MTPVTSWYRRIPLRTSADDFEFNHIEDGHGLGEMPMKPQFKGQAESNWSSIESWLTADVPPRLVSYGPDDL